nr:hypothetical protein [Tanacetum cinerariifolium]
MLKKPQVVYDDTYKQALGYQNPFYLKKAQRIKQTLYDDSVISSQHAIILVIDDEETLILDEAPRELPKVSLKNLNLKKLKYYLPPDDNFNLEPKVISAVMEDIDEPDEHFNPEGEIFVSTNIEDVDYFPFMFVIRIFLPYLILPEISPILLSAESEDTVFDPGISD